MSAERPAACGHDPAEFVTADEGTSYCPACEDEARSAAYLHDGILVENKERDDAGA